MDSKFGVVLFHHKKAKLWIKIFDGVIKVLNVVMKIARFDGRSTCPHLLRNKPL